MITLAGPDDVDWLRGWLDPTGVAAPGRPRVDAELRWLIVAPARRARRGAARPTSTPSTTVTAPLPAPSTRRPRRAARPDAAAKASAWAALIDDDTLSNRLLFATAARVLAAPVRRS